MLAHVHVNNSRVLTTDNFYTRPQLNGKLCKWLNFVYRWGHLLSMPACSLCSSLPDKSIGSDCPKRHTTWSGHHRTWKSPAQIDGPSWRSSHGKEASSWRGAGSCPAAMIPLESLPSASALSSQYKCLVQKVNTQKALIIDQVTTTWEVTLWTYSETEWHEHC